MRGTSRGVGALSGFALVVMSVLVASIALGTGVASADGGVSLSCADGTGGAVYIADSGLTVYEDASEVTHGTFEDRDTVSFAGTAISGAGNAAVRLETATGTRTCLSDVDPGTGALTVAPPDAPTVIFDSPVSKIAYRDPTYLLGEPEADVAVETTGPVTLQLRSTGLDPGTTVVVVDIDADREIQRVNATSTGTVMLDVPSGVQAIDLFVNPDVQGQVGSPEDGTQRPVSPTETATRTATETSSRTPTPTAAQTGQPEGGTATATPTPTRQSTAAGSTPIRADRTPSVTETDEESDPDPFLGGGPLDPLLAVVGILGAVALLAGAVRVLRGE